MIYVIGIGVDGRAGLGKRALDIIDKAGLIVGGKRHLKEFEGLRAQSLPIEGSLEAVASGMKGFIKANGKKNIAVLATGDPLLFGAASYIIKKFGKRSVSVIPNVSTVQEAFARVKESANGVKVLSAHGKNTDIEGLCEDIKGSVKTAVFTDPENSPARIARALIDKGAKGLIVHVCESLGMKGERVIKGDLKKIASIKKFSPLNVMIIIGKDVKKAPHRAGVPDSMFCHSSGMITKRDYRVLSLSRLSLERDSLVWDIGACSGSVSIEAALTATDGMVYAVEKDKRRVQDIKKNIKAFGAENVEVVEGSAPECLKGLPEPDAVFVGGGGAGITGILGYVSRRIKTGGRVVVNAVTLETANAASSFFKKKGWKREFTLVNISWAKELGDLSMLHAYNPVFMVVGTRPR